MAIGLVLNRSRQVPAEHSPAFGGIAERFRRAGELDRAVGLCQEGLGRFPDHLSARVTLGWALLDLGRYEEARTELEQVLKRAPDNLAAIRGLAELHGRTEHDEMSGIHDAPWQSLDPSMPAPGERGYRAAPPQAVTHDAPEHEGPLFGATSHGGLTHEPIDVPALPSPDDLLALPSLVGLEAGNVTAGSALEAPDVVVIESAATAVASQPAAMSAASIDAVSFDDAPALLESIFDPEIAPALEADAAGASLDIATWTPQVIDPVVDPPLDPPIEAAAVVDADESSTPSQPSAPVLQLVVPESVTARYDSEFLQEAPEPVFLDVAADEEGPGPWPPIVMDDPAPAAPVLAVSASPEAVAVVETPVKSASVLRSLGRFLRRTESRRDSPLSETMAG